MRTIRYYGNRNRLLLFGALILAIAALLLVFRLSQVVMEPDPRFDVEVSSFSNGSAQFEYIPITNDTASYTADYRAMVDDETVQEVNNRTIDGVSRDNPITVFVRAESDQTVSVDMNIWSQDGQRLHSSSHIIGP